MAKMQATEAIAKVLKASGVEYIFGMDPGFPFFLTPSLIESGIKMITTRNEMHGAFMATGYSRVSGKPGICSAPGIGASHMAVGLREAQGSANPVVAITSDHAQRTTWKSTPHFIDLDALLRPIAKWLVRSEVLPWLPDLMRKALEVAATGAPGPVAVIVPSDMMGEEVDFELPTEWGEIRCPRIRIAPEPESIERAAELLLKAKRPAIIAGGGVMLSRASNELVELAELLAIPVATSHIAQSVFPNKHPLSLGVVGNATPNGRGRVANKLIGQADVALFVGTRMDRPTTNDWTLPSAATSKIIHIDIDPVQVGYNCPVEVGIVADARLALKALKDAVQGKQKKATSVADTPRVREIQALIKEWRDKYTPLMNSNEVPIKTPRLFTEIQKFLNPDTIVVVDVGSSLHWAANYLEAGPDTPIIYPQGFVALGTGFPMAMGAQVAAPNKRIIHIAGDGGFGYNIMELETCVRYNLPVVNIILNNRCYGAAKTPHGSNREVTPEVDVSPEVCDFSPQNFSKIAQAFGAFGVRAEKPREIRGAIEAALASGKPAIVDVVTSADEALSTEIPMLGARFL